MLKINKSNIAKFAFACLFATCASTLAYAQFDNDYSLNNDSDYKVHAVLVTETQAAISSPMAGLIEKLNIKEGSFFKKGDLLLQFDCEIRDAELKKAQAQVKLAEINYDSYKRLEKLNSASKVKVAESEAQYKEAMAEQQIAQHNADNCQIIAPFNGQVTDIFIHQHETVQLHQKLFDVLNNDDLLVKVIVPSAWLTWIKKGTAFSLHVKENNKTYTGQIVRIVTRIDAVSRSVKLIGEVDGAHTELQSGMSGEATFTPDKAKPKITEKSI